MNFTHAIVRKPGRSLIDGISQTPEMGKPIYEVALKQHAAYVKALKACGLEVTVLEANEDFPDSTFVEDVAICTRDMVVLTRPGAETRRLEAKLPDMWITLERFYGDKIYEIEAPGLLDGGDVVMAGDHFYIGLSKRTNQSGAEQLASYLEKHGYTAEIVPILGILHLKGDISYLTNNDVVVTCETAKRPIFAKYNQIVADDDEIYAANCIWLNGKVIVSEGYPKIADKIRQAGYEVILVPMTEYHKITGSLTCLSLRF